MIASIIMISTMMLGTKIYRLISVSKPIRRFHSPGFSIPSSVDSAVPLKIIKPPMNGSMTSTLNSTNDVSFYWESYHAMRSAISNPTEERVSRFLVCYVRAEPGIKRTMANITMMETSAQIFTRSRAAGKISDDDLESLKLLNDKIGITRGERIRDCVIIGAFGIFFVTVFAISFG